MFAAYYRIADLLSYCRKDIINGASSVAIPASRGIEKHLSGKPGFPLKTTGKDVLKKIGIL
ncbi:MAG: hypothetical protein B6D37_02005 [Sphingobacteriales bacterium UTBCD1]|nr:MAG: hypothetical protein B6D37_02005 [Sphingobacteriales bacterium UTBCD1]